MRHRPVRNRLRRPQPARPRTGAFTLIEMVVVMAMIALLLTLAVPRYFKTLERGKVSVQQQNLSSIRDAIDKFFGDRGRYPETLEELVKERYLRSVPVDPVSEKSDWVLVPPSDPQLGAIYDVNSADKADHATQTNNKRAGRGVVLLALLLTLALMSIALLGEVKWWSAARQREAEADLMYVGDQYRKAIQKYYYATPAPVKVFPKRLEDLLEDDRFPVPVRHLRRLYADPLSNAPLEIIRVGDDIVGVASTSTGKPFKRTGFAAPYAGFEEKESYAEWKFVFNPPLRLRTLPARKTGSLPRPPPLRITP